MFHARYVQNHRIYYTLTKDFRTFAKTALLCDGGFNAIDAVVVRDGSRWLMFVKDETRRPQPKKNIRLAVGEKMTGPYGPAGEPFTPDWVEGPTVLKIDGWWIVYYNEYTRRRYGAVRSRPSEMEIITEQQLSSRNPTRNCF